ncbi:MAG: hypothetical protein JNK02_06930, partial [Planctomycetes bacterium]|nr:hypothetical protein [Planctomycetota bacterium]
PPILLALRGDEIRADRGLLAGIEVGTVLAAVADGAPLDAEPVLELEVVEAGVYDARGRLRSGAVPDGATTLRARVVSRPVSDFSLALALVAPDGSARGTDDLPERVRAFLSAEGGRFRLVARAAEADWSLVVDGQHLHLRAADRIGSHDVLDVAPERLPLVLGRIRRAFGLRRACALFDAPDPSLDVWVERRPRGGAVAVRLAPGDRLVPGDELRVMLHKTGGGIVDANVYYLDASHGIQRLFPRAGGTARLEPKAEAPLEIVSWTPVIDDALGIENLWVLAVPRGPADPVLALQDLSQDPTTTRGLAVESAARGILQELLTEPRTRGIAAAGDEPVRRGSVFQVPLHTDWPPLGPPAWSAGELGRLDSPHPFLAGLPVDFEAGPCWQQSSSPAAAGRRDILLLGSPERPRAVLVDFSSPAAEGTPDAASFDPEAAFLFLDDGRRLSLYDRGDAGRFDLALLDADGDGVAEVRWTRTGAEWILQPAVRVPWLSQSHLQSSVLGPRRELATARFSVLARGSGP